MELAAEMTAARELAVANAQQATALQKIIWGYVEMYPELGKLVEGQMDLPHAPPPPTDAGAPRGAEAVRFILQAEPGYPFYVSEVVDRLRNRGWLPAGSDNPANAIRTALERLVASAEDDVYKGQMRTVQGAKVTYTYDPDRAPANQGAGYGFEEETF